jgi:hypothetical protein
MSQIDDLLRRIQQLESRLARVEARGPLAGVMGQRLATTNAVGDVMALERTTTGTAADGIGAGMVFRLPDASGNMDEAARIDAVLTTAAHATEAAALKLYILGTNALILDSAGNGFVLRGLRVGSASPAPGDNNLVVDGETSTATLKIGATYTFVPSTDHLKTTFTVLCKADTASAFYVSGGNAYNDGARILMHGSTHATLANTMILYGTTIQLGSANSDNITCIGRLKPRTTASDPQHATPASRPAGTVGEIAYYGGKWYGCTNAATPLWEKFTSA